MLYYIKKYPFSWLVVGTVVYLSFFRPPSLNLPTFDEMDKVLHFIMYGGVSGIMWLEFLWNHRKDAVLPVRHAIIGAMICPVVFGGIIELLQEYITPHRNGDWIDFAANTTGVLIASATVWYLIRPHFLKCFGDNKNK